MKHKHLWTYFGGDAKCKCGRYLQPDGKITATPGGRPRKKAKVKKSKRKGSSKKLNS